MIIKRAFIIFLLMVTGLAAMAASRLYSGNSTYSGKVLYTCDGAIPVPLLLVMAGIL